MKYGFYFVLTLGLIFGAYQMAQNKMGRPLHLDSLRLGLSVQEIEHSFGTPSSESRNSFTYVLNDGSVLSITFRDQKVSSAKIRFSKPMKIQDPEIRKLTLVQMDSEALQTSNPSWFFAGKPEKGLIYKITSDGTIESLTWVPPFTYAHNQPKRLQALLSDFKSQRSL